MGRCGYVIHTAADADCRPVPLYATVAPWWVSSWFQNIRCEDEDGHGFEHTACGGTFRWTTREGFLIVPGYRRPPYHPRRNIHY